MNGIKELITYLTNQFKFWFIVKEWESGLQLRNGKVVRSLEYGIYFRIPFLDSVFVKPKRLQDVIISQVNFTTKDGKNITASATAFFRIDNILDYYNGYAEPFSIIDGIIKNESNRYFLKTNYDDFDQLDFEYQILQELNCIQGKGILFEDFKLITFSNAKTYRIITDNLYSQASGYLDDECY